MSAKFQEYCANRFLGVRYKTANGHTDGQHHFHTSLPISGGW
jgi:hypothetical protein